MVGAVEEMMGRGLVLCRPLGWIVLSWRIPPPLRGARAARRHVRAGYSLIFSDGAGHRL
jgi:hypothetical protein